MRLHYKPDGLTDWIETLGCLAGLGGLAWLSYRMAPVFERPLWQVLVALLAMATVLVLLSPNARMTFSRGMLGWFSPLFPQRDAEGTIIHSEAERDRQDPDDLPDGTNLSVRARYIIEVELEDGTCRTCALPRKLWARYRVGMKVSLRWQGIWLRDLTASTSPSDHP